MKARGLFCSLSLLAVCQVVAGAQSAEPPETRPPAWRVTALLAGGWESNPFFLASASDASYLGTLDLAVSHLRRRPRSELTLQVEGAGVVYSDASRLNRLNHAGRLLATIKPAPRLQLRVSEQYSSGYAGSSPVLLESGLLYPALVTRTNRAATGLNWRPSARSDVDLDIRYDRVDFPAGALGDASVLVFAPSVSRLFASRDAFGLSGSYQQTFNGRVSGRVQTLAMRWNRAIEQRFRLDVGLGVLRVSSDDAAALVRPSGVLSLSSRGRRTALAIRYARTATPAYGPGRDRLADVFSGSFDLEASRRLLLGLQASWGRSRDPLDRADGSTMSGFGGELRLKLTRRLRLESHYALRTSSAIVGGIETRGHMAGLGLSYDKAW